jgi:hypothetical protein
VCLPQMLELYQHVLGSDSGSTLADAGASKTQPSAVCVLE